MKYLYEMITEDESGPSANYNAWRVIIAVEAVIFKEIMVALPPEVLRKPEKTPDQYYNEFISYYGNYNKKPLEEEPVGARYRVYDSAYHIVNHLKYSLNESNPIVAKMTSINGIFKRALSYNWHVNRNDILKRLGAKKLPVDLLSDNSIGAKVISALKSAGYNVEQDYKDYIISGNGLGENSGLNIQTLLSYIRNKKLTAFRAKNKLSVGKIIGIILDSRENLEDEDVEDIKNWLGRELDATK